MCGLGKIESISPINTSVSLVKMVVGARAAGGGGEDKMTGQVFSLFGTQCQHKQQLFHRLLIVLLDSALQVRKHPQEPPPPPPPLPSFLLSTFIVFGVCTEIHATAASVLIAGGPCRAPVK